MSQSPADGPDGVPSWDAFSGDGPACAPPPGPELAALLGEAVGALDELDERQLLGAGSAARRMRAHADYIEVLAVARFGRRRAEQLEASKARGDRVRSRDGEYAAEELGFEMTASAYSASLLLDMAANIVNRLPSTLAGMAAGVIDRDRARVISNATLHLSDELAAEADKILADAAPELRLADLQNKAARLEARLDPEGVQRRKDEARHDRRVELRREDSGAASCRAGSWTRPRRWRGRRRSTPRRSGCATRACPAPWPRSGRRSCWTGSPAQPLGPPRPAPRRTRTRRRRRPTTTPAPATTPARDDDSRRPRPRDA